MDFYNKLIYQITGSRNFASANHIRLLKIEPNYAEAELEIVPESLNFMGNVHGGCLASLADTCAGAATRSLGKGCVTLSSTMNYLAPGTGSKLRAEARIVKGGNTITVTDVTILDEQGVKVATGTFTFFLMGPPVVVEPPEDTQN